MTSEERREYRYQRRKAKRDAKKKEALKEYDDYYNVINRNALSRAAKCATKGVKYKASVKRFMLKRLVNVARISTKLTYRKDIRKGFICFTLTERGKVRHIMSVHFSERIVQKSLNQNALVPIMTRSLIYDNGASQRKKGTHFAVRRMVTHLSRHYRHHGNNGYILLIDFHDYFGRIDHEISKQQIRGFVTDPNIIWLCDLFIDSYYEYNVKKKKLPENEARKGLGLGSEINQTLAISYPNELDHYVKEKLRIHGYGRYMDDSYLIHESKEYLEYCLQEIRKICGKLKITINEKKTMIVKLSHGFTFLKNQIYLTETGKIIKKPCHSAVVRERRKLKKQKRLVDSGEMSFENVEDSYTSWRGSMNHRNARRTVHSMDILYNSLFINSWQRGGECDGRENNGDSIGNFRIETDSSKLRLQSS